MIFSPNGYGYKILKKTILIIHIIAIIIILSDNIVIFQFLKKNSNIIKDKISSVSFLKNITFTVIRDFNYRKPEILVNEDHQENKEMIHNIIEIIGEKRFQQQQIFLKHYRESESILSNTMFLGDLIHEFMANVADTLFLPFIGNPKYCYDIMDTEWCQYQTIDLFVFPIIVYLSDYNPELSANQYLSLKKVSDISIRGMNGILFNFAFNNTKASKQPYYLFVYNKEVFVTTGDLIWSE